MEWRPRFRRARFVLQPWRYELEYARVWREASFPIFTLASPVPSHRRFGGKGRGGRVPRRPFHRAPMWLWSDLTNLEAIESGPDWRVRISSQCEAFTSATRWPEFLREQVADLKEVDTEDIVLDRIDIAVAGRPVEYHGLSILGMWWGAPVEGQAPFVKIEGLAPDTIALATIQDPSVHLSKAT